MELDDRPIGLFDSGIGGLTVLKSLMTQLPHESFIYLGDTARLPYGSKSPSTIERYLKQNIRFLTDLNVKAIVVACNSASTVLLKSHAPFSVPVYNVIQPGAQAALAESRTKRIGVLGTKATVSAQAYVTALHALDSTVIVYQQACPLLVPLVEEGWEDDPLTNLVVYRYLTPLLQEGIDTLILGCTHYPVLREAIARVSGSRVTLVDSAEAIASAISSDFSKGHLKPASPTDPSSIRKQAPLRLMTTDISPGFEDVAIRLMHPHIIPNLEAVDIGTI